MLPVMPMAVRVGAGQRMRREVHAADDGEDLLDLLRRGVALHDDEHGVPAERVGRIGIGYDSKPSQEKQNPPQWPADGRFASVISSSTTTSWSGHFLICATSSQKRR